jgi:hypothetical protein
MEEPSTASAWPSAGARGHLVIRTGYASISTACTPTSRTCGPPSRVIGAIADRAFPSESKTRTQVPVPAPSFIHMPFWNPGSALASGIT